MDHAYTMSGSQDLATNTQTNSAEMDDEDVEDLEDVHENDDDNVYDGNQEDDSMDDCQEYKTDHTFAGLGDGDGDDVPNDTPVSFNEWPIKNE